MSKRVYWLSVHPPLPSQARALTDLFGPVEIIEDRRPFDDSEQILARYRIARCDEMVAVATLQIIARLLDKGLRPLWAEMEQVPISDAEVRTGRPPRGYRFLRFRRIVRLKLEFEDI